VGAFYMQNFKSRAKVILVAVLFTLIVAPAFAGKDFIKKDLRSEDTIVVKVLAQKLSNEHLTLIVHGGSKALMMSAYEAAQKLDEDGHSIAFFLAGSSNGDDSSAQIEFYVDGFSAFSAVIRREPEYQRVSNVDRVLKSAHFAIERAITVRAEVNKAINSYRESSSKILIVNHRSYAANETEKLAKENCGRLTGTESCRNKLIYVVYGNNVSIASNTLAALDQISVENGLDAVFVWANQFVNNSGTIAVAYMNGNTNGYVADANIELIKLRGMDSYLDFMLLKTHDKELPGYAYRESAKTILKDPAAFARKSGLSQSDIPALKKHALEVLSWDNSDHVKARIEILESK